MELNETPSKAEPPVKYEKALHDQKLQKMKKDNNDFDNQKKLLV